MGEQKASTLGEKLKALRQKSDLTLKQVAEMTGLSSSFLSQVERGHTTMGSKNLEIAARTFNVPISYFFDNEAKATGGDPVIRSYERLGLVVARDFIQYSLSKDLEHDLIKPSVRELRPFLVEEQLSSVYSHSAEELVYVLEGVLTMVIDNREYTLFPHDCVHVPSNAEHAWCNKTSGITKLISFFSE